MTKLPPHFMFLLPWLLSFPCYAEHASTDSAQSKPRYQTDGTSVISATDCDKYHFSKYSGLTIYNAGEKKHTGAQPLYPLYSQIRDEHKETRGWASPHGGGSYEVTIFDGYHNGLSPRIFENFSTLLSHALECQAKGNSGFLEALKEDLEYQKNSDFFHKRYSSKDGKFITDRSEEKFPEITRNKEILDLLVAQIDLLEDLRKYSPEFFSGLQEQIAKNTNPKDGYISQKLQKAVTDLKHKVEKQDGGEAEIGKALHLAELIKNNPIFASLLPPDQSAYYRQLLSIGPSMTLAPLTENSKQEKFSEHEQRLSQVLQNAFNGQSASAQFLADPKKRNSPSGLDRLNYWNDFEAKFADDLAKLKTPEERNQVRDRVMKGLQELSHGSNWTQNYPPTTSHAQEALIRASRLIEKQAEDPIAGRKSEIEQLQKGDYSHQISQLKTSFRRPKDANGQQIEKTLNKAEAQFNITIPEAIKNKIRQMDPFLLDLLKDNVKGGDLAKTEAFKKFFLTGHSTALFNLKDENIARLLFGRLENLSRNSPLLKDLSGEEKQFLSQGLWAIVKPGSMKEDEWRKNYSKIRNQLLKPLEPFLSQINNPPTGYRNLPNDVKALLYTIEMLDSLGNHNVNPYAFWEKPETSQFYETESVAHRMAEEAKLLKQTKASSQQVEQRLSGLLPTAEIHGLPTHARVAHLTRMAQGSEGSEQENLKLLGDIISHKGNRTPTRSEIDQLKSLVFTNSDPSNIQIALQSRVPELFKLLTTVQDQIPGPIDNSEQRAAWEEQNKKRSELIQKEVRKAQSDLIDRLHHTDQEPARSQLVSALYVLRKIDAAGPEAFQTWLNSSEPQDLADKALVGAAFQSSANQSRFSLEPFMDKLDGMAGKEDKETVARFQLAQNVEDSFLGLAKLKTTLGENDPRVQTLETALRSNFGKEFSELQQKAKAKLNERTLKQENGKRSLLSKYPNDLKWNEEFQAFEVDKNKSAISERMLGDLEKEYPGFKVVFRDHTSGTSEPHHDGRKALEDWIEDRSVDFLNEGLYVGEGQWFPLNDKTAIKLKRQGDGSLKPELGDRAALEQQLQKHIKETQDAENNYHNAKEKFGSFWHGAEGFARGLGNFYLLGLVDGPEGSKKTKNLTQSYAQYRAAVSGLSDFGQLGADANNTARKEIRKRNDWTKTALQQERQSIQSYEDNAMLTHDITLFLLSLPVGGIGAQVEKTAITSAERIVLQKALEKTTDAAVRQGLSKLLAQEVITVAQANASRQIIGTAAREFSKSTLGRMGMNQFSKQLVQSTKTAGIFSIPLGIGLASEEISAATKRNDIETKFKQGKEWRKYPNEPQREEGKSEAQFEKEWLEWYAESQFDRNRDGKPDFLQSELKDVAISGPDRARYAQGFFDTQRTFFEMGMVGQALPNSGMLTHIFGSQMMEQELRILHGRGKASNPSQPQTQLGALWDATKGTAHMVPGIVLQRLGMAALPPGLQKNFQLGKSKTNTREIVGVAGFTLGNQSATALAEGKIPKLTDVNTLTSIGMDFYIGRSMAQHANLKLAQEALKQLPRPSNGALALEGPGSKTLNSSRQKPQTIEDVAKAYGSEAVEFALFNMSPKQLAEAKSPQLLEQATQYFKTRRAQLAEQVKDNPHAQKGAEQIFQELQAARKELRGTGYFRMSPEQRAQKYLEITQLEKALEFRNVEGYQQNWAQTSASARMQESLTAHLNHINSPEVQQKVKILFQELGTPELGEALIQSGKQAISTPTKLGQTLTRAYDAVDQYTGLPSAVYKLSAPSNETLHQRANDVLIRAYRDKAGEPEVQKRLGFFIVLNRAEAFGALKSSEIKTETDKDATKVYALYEMARLGLVTRDSAREPVKKTMNEFVDFVTAPRENSSDKTLKDLWTIYSAGGTDGAQGASRALPPKPLELPGRPGK
ncbi:MAG: hypothetical protein FJ112_03550 [Deltaproteobacteria bacterium]|nr:hypothetical protein [Deltaproteobacteria bacterium]